MYRLLKFALLLMFPLGLVQAAGDDVRYADYFPGSDFGAKVTAAVADLPLTGGVVDARWLGSAQSTVATIALTGKPIHLILNQSLTLTCGAGANPCISYGSNTVISAPYAGTRGIVATIRTSTPGNTILRSATPSANVANLRVEGVGFYNSSSATAPVVDLTMTSDVTFDHVSSQAGGMIASLIYCSTTYGLAAYYNTMYSVQLYGGGNGYDIRNGCNDFKVFGGTISTTVNPINIQGTNSLITNGVSFYDVSAEVWTGSLLSVPSYAYAIRWYGGRIESVTGTILNIGATGTSQIYINQPDIAGAQTYGTDNGKVSWYYKGGTPGPLKEFLITGGMDLSNSGIINVGVLKNITCLEVGNSDGTVGINYITVLNGVLAVATIKPNICQ